METLHNLTSVLRPYWKNLQFLNEDDTTITLDSYLEDWDDTYRTDILYFSHDNRPDTFEFDCYSFLTFPEEEKANLDAQIDKLIETTSLCVPETKSCLVVDESVRHLLDQKLANQCADLTHRLDTATQNGVWTVLKSVGAMRVSLLLSFFLFMQ